MSDVVFHDQKMVERADARKDACLGAGLYAEVSQVGGERFQIVECDVPEVFSFSRKVFQKLFQVAEIGFYGIS